MKLIRTLASQGKTPQQIAETVGVSLSTVYRYLKTPSKTKKQNPQPKKDCENCIYRKLLQTYKEELNEAEEEIRECNIILDRTFKELEKVKKENLELRKENRELRDEIEYLWTQRRRIPKLIPI